jgi:hypothetical protein
MDPMLIGDGIEVFSRASDEAGTVAYVTAPAEVRLDRADVTELWLLDHQAAGGREIRVPVGLTTPEIAFRPNPSTSDEFTRDGRSLPS